MVSLAADSLQNWCSLWGKRQQRKSAYASEARKPGFIYRGGNRVGFMRRNRSDPLLSPEAYALPRRPHSVDLTAPYRCDFIRIHLRLPPHRTSPKAASFPYRHCGNASNPLALAAGIDSQRSKIQ